MIPWYNINLIWNGVLLDFVEQFQLDIEVNNRLFAVFNGMRIGIYHLEVKTNDKEECNIYVESF